MTIRAQLPDGRELEFPDGTDTNVIQGKVKELLGGGGQSPPVSASSPILTPSNRAVSPGSNGSPEAPAGMSVPDAILAEAPQTMGSIAGAGLAASTLTAGGSVIAPLVAGASLGGGFGEAMKQIGQHLSGSLDAPRTSTDAAKRIGKAALAEGGFEAVGGFVAKGFGKILSPFSKTMKEGVGEAMDYFKDKIKPVLLPAEATESRILDVLHNISESSLIGGNQMAKYKTARTKFFDDFADSIVDQFGSRTSPDDLGNLFVTAIEGKKKIHQEAAGVLYNSVSDIINKTPTVKSSKNFYSDVEGFVRNPKESIKRAAEYEKSQGEYGMEWVKDSAQEILEKNPEIGLKDFIIETEKYGRSPGEIPEYTAWKLFNELSDNTGGGQIRVPTSSLKDFASKVRVHSTELGGIEAKNAGDDLMSAVVDLPDNLSFDAAVELRSRLISRVDEFSVLNRKAPAIGKAKKMISLIDTQIEQSLREFSLHPKNYISGVGGDIPSITGSRRVSSESGKLAPYGGGWKDNIDAVESGDKLLWEVDNFTLDNLVDKNSLANFERVTDGKHSIYFRKDRSSEAVELANRALKLQDAGLNTPGKMVEFGKLMGYSDNDIKFYLDKNKINSPSALEAWRTANRFYKEGQEQFNNTFLRRLVKLADDTGTGAENIAPAIFQPGQVSKVRKVKRALGEGSEEWNKMQGFFAQHLMSKSTDVNGNVIGKRLMNNLSGKPNSFGEPLLREVLSESQIREIKLFATVLQESQRKQSEGAGRMLIQLTQAGAVGALATGNATLPAATIILGPPLLSKLMLNPTTSRLLTTGIQTPASGKVAAGVMSRLVAAAERIHQRTQGE